MHTYACMHANVPPCHAGQVTLHSLDDHLDDMRELEETAYAQLNSTDDNFSARTDAQFAYLGI